MYYLAENEASLTFTVKTCSRVRVRLLNGNVQPQYLLEFPGSDSEASNITIVATGETANASTPMTWNCTKLRKFWVSRSNGVISAGSGWTPGKKEIIRVADGKNTKNVVMAQMSTEPTDENATFVVYRSKLLLSFAVDFSCHKKCLVIFRNHQLLLLINNLFAMLTLVVNLCFLVLGNLKKSLIVIDK